MQDKYDSFTTIVIGFESTKPMIRQ